MKTLTPRWLFQYRHHRRRQQPDHAIVVDGTMYVTDPRGGVYALDASDGRLLWSFDVTNLIGGGRREGYIFRNRGAAYADGVVYTAAGSFLFALDAKTGKPIPTFGTNGQAAVILDNGRDHIGLFDRFGNVLLVTRRQRSFFILARCITSQAQSPASARLSPAARHAVFE